MATRLLSPPVAVVTTAPVDPFPPEVELKAVVFAGEGRIEVDEVDEPVLLEPGDAVVQVSLTSICGSDLHLLDGKTPGMRVGGVIGHEFVGVVADVGAGVPVKPGQRVLGSFLIACGECSQCRALRFNFCKSRRALGLGTLTGDLDGAQAEYVRVPNAALNLKVLTDVSDEQALFAGDVLATGFYGAALAEAGRDQTVGVIGAGPVGLLCALAAKSRGARVLVFDADAERVRFAREKAGLEAFEVGDADAGSLIAEATDGAMADAVVDAVGVVPVVKSGLRCVRDGGRVVVLGVYGAERYELPMGVTWVRGIDLRFAGMANVQAHWDEALQSVTSGAIDPEALMTHRLPLEDAVRGYELFRAREAMKVVLLP